MFYVYVDYTDDGIPFYVGKGNQERFNRLKRKNKKHTAIAKKYGQNRRSVLETENEKLVFEKEKELIKELHTYVEDPLAHRFASNFTLGGEGPSGRKHTQKELEKLSILSTGRILSKEHCENISNGLKKSERAKEQRKRLHEAKKGKPRNKEIREKISKSLKGKPLNSSAAERIKKSQKPVIQYTLDGVLIAIYESIRKASISVCGNDNQASHISEVCRGCRKRKTCAGYIWRYADDET